MGESGKTYAREDEIPTRCLALVRAVVPALLAGEHPALAALRAQFETARVSLVDFTGVGFFATFSISDDRPLSEPLDVTGGDAELTIDGIPSGAGCLLYIRAGRLSCLEVYCHDGEWTEDAALLRMSNVKPLFGGSDQ